MKKHYLFFAFLVAGLFLFSSSSNNPPNGRTGAPGEGLCTDCHASGNSGLNGELEVTGLPDLISPGGTYRLTVTVRNPNGLASSAGFQMTILGETDEQSGTLSNASSQATITNAGGRSYFEHNPAVDFPGSNEVTWSVDWTAPDGPLESGVAYYAVGNIANGNGQNSGDLVITATGTGVLSETSATRAATFPELRVFPNPADEVLMVMDGGRPVERFEIVDQSGREVLRSENPGGTAVDVSTFHPGMYFLRVWKEDRFETIRWVKR